MGVGSRIGGGKRGGGKRIQLQQNSWNGEWDGKTSRVVVGYIEFSE